MDLLNIGISGLPLNSNVQIDDAFLMYDVIGKASLVKSVREAVQEYDIEIPLGIAALERRLGQNVDVAASTSMKETEFTTGDVDNKEEIQEAITSF